VLALIDLVKNWGNGTIFSVQVKMGKNAKLRISTFFLTTAYQRRLVQNFSKLYRKLILIWAFRKSTLETDTKKSCFFWVCLSDSNIWMSLKKILTNFRLGTFFFLNFNYFSIWKCKRLKIPVSWRRKKFFLLLDPKTPKRPNSLLVWIDQKNVFSNYVIWFV
jgi:hypothetical protein